MSPMLVHLKPLCIVSPTPSAFDTVMASNDLSSTSPPVLPCSATFWLCPHLFDTLSTTLSPFDIATVSNNAPTAWDAFLAPYCLVRLPLSFVSPTSLCLMLQQPFHPSDSFAHPIPVRRRQKMFKRLGMHSSSPTLGSSHILY